MLQSSVPANAREKKAFNRLLLHQLCSFVILKCANIFEIRHTFRRKRCSISNRKYQQQLIIHTSESPTLNFEVVWRVLSKIGKKTKTGDERTYIFFIFIFDAFHVLLKWNSSFTQNQYHIANTLLSFIAIPRHCIALWYGYGFIKLVFCRNEKERQG